MTRLEIFLLDQWARARGNQAKRKTKPVLPLNPGALYAAFQAAGRQLARAERLSSGETKKHIRLARSELAIAILKAYREHQAPWLRKRGTAKPQK